MNFMPAAWQVRRARAALEAWNEANPGRSIPWEWVEEALLSWRAWKEAAHYDADLALKHLERNQEFVDKLPAELVALIWPTAQSGERR